MIAPARFADIGELKLERGGVLSNARIAYQTRGRLSEAGDNAILVLHGYTGGPDMILPGGMADEGSWEEIIGSGRPIDSDRYFVVCPNSLGSTFGSTGSASINAATGNPYGSSFPEITMRDVVASQHALLTKLGINKLAAVIGPSFGGLQALQWAVSYPHFVGCLVVLSASLGSPPANVEGVRASLARDPNWNNGDYYSKGNLIDTLAAIRVETLKSYGVENALSRIIPDVNARAKVIADKARRWAERFDANALLVIMKIIATHDVTSQLHRIRAPLLYVLSRTDHLFPPTLAEDAMKRFKEAGVSAEYFEIDSENGHAAAAVDVQLWAPFLRRFLERQNQSQSTTPQYV
jgi:homoserine O-acetyltransferase/O-succinyltransferase